MTPVRVGCIGLGFISEHAHLPALAALAEEGKIVFQAFCDMSEETLKTQAAIYKPQATYTDHHEMLDKEDLDAVYLCIPPAVHSDELLIAADKDIALFVEKPQTLDLAQAEVQGGTVGNRYLGIDDARVLAGRAYVVSLIDRG